MAAVGVLNLLFQADTKQATTGIAGFVARTKSQLTGLGGQVSGFASTIGGGFGGLVAGVGVGVGAFAISVAKSVKENQKWADSLGVPVRRLSALQAIAAKYGVTAERIGDAQKDLNEKIADAASGTKTYQESLTAMGLNWRDLKGMRADEQFFKVAAAIQKMGDSGEQSFRAMELMSDAGFDVLGMIRQNGSALKEMTLEMEKSSLIITNRQTASLLSLGESWSNLTSKAGGFADVMAAIVSPVIENFLNKISLAIDGIGWAIQGVVSLANSFTDKLQGIADFASSIRGDVLGIGEIPNAVFSLAREFFGFGSSDKSKTIAAELDAKEKQPGDAAKKSSFVAPTDKTGVTAMQINPNQIRLGNINDGGSMQQKQLTAQQMIASNTSQMTTKIIEMTNALKKTNQFSLGTSSQ